MLDSHKLCGAELLCPWGFVRYQPRGQHLIHLWRKRIPSPCALYAILFAGWTHGQIVNYQTTVPARYMVPLSTPAFFFFFFSLPKNQAKRPRVSVGLHITAHPVPRLTRPHAAWSDTQTVLWLVVCYIIVVRFPLVHLNHNPPVICWDWSWGYIAGAQWVLRIRGTLVPAMPYAETILTLTKVWRVCSTCTWIFHGQPN